MLNVILSAACDESNESWRFWFPPYNIQHSTLNIQHSTFNISDFQHQSVVRQPYPLRQRRFHRLVIDLVRQMDQPRLARVDSLRSGNGLLDHEVRGMSRAD